MEKVGPSSYNFHENDLIKKREPNYT